MVHNPEADRSEFKLDEHIEILRLKHGYFVILKDNENEWKKLLIRKKPWKEWIEGRVRKKESPPISTQVNYYKKYGRKRIIVKTSNSLSVHKALKNNPGIKECRWFRHNFAALHQIKMNLCARQKYWELYGEELSIEQPIGAYVDNNGDRCAFYIAEDIIFEEDYKQFPGLKTDQLNWKLEMEQRLRRLGFDVNTDFQIMAVRDSVMEKGYRFMIMDTDRWITREEAEKYDNVTG